MRLGTPAGHRLVAQPARHRNINQAVAVHVFQLLATLPVLAGVCFRRPR
jgi:hypothetical protein